MHTRPATPADIPLLNQLVNSAYRGDSSRAGWTTEADLLDGIRTSETSLQSLLSEPGSVMLLAEAESEMQGCVHLKTEGQSLYLGMLTVKPTAQGQGIGASLMQSAEAYAAQVGCGSIRMTVISVRTELIDYYRRKGFRLTGERLPFPNDPAFGIPKQPLEFVVMEKNLSA